MTSRERQAIATRQKLIHSAEKLIRQLGYDNVSVDQIVTDCGVAKGTFYHHFKSKDEIISEICGSIYDDLREETDAIPNLTPLQRLFFFITNWHKRVATYNIHIARQTIKLYTDLSIVGDYGEKVSQMEHGIHLLEEYLNAAVIGGELIPDTPAETLARALMFTMQGATIYHCKHEQDFNVMAWNEEFQQNVLHPLLTPYIVQQKKYRD